MISAISPGERTDRCGAAMRVGNCRACGILVEAADCEVLDGVCDDCRHMAALRARLRGESEEGAIERWMAANELDEWCERILERRAA